MRFKVIKNNIFPIGYRGTVLWPFIFIRPYDSEVSNRMLFRHELQHCYQIKERGIVRFYVRYLWLLLRHGYRNHPDEAEAYDLQHWPLTEQEEEWYKKGEVTL